MQSDILYPVSSSKWTGPVVHVPKSDGSIRVCRDYKAINECIEYDVYKLANNNNNNNNNVFIKKHQIKLHI